MKYFIWYGITKDGVAIGEGNCVLETKYGITGIEDIRRIEEQLLTNIQADSFIANKVFVRNFIRMEE